MMEEFGDLWSSVFQFVGELVGCRDVGWLAGSFSACLPSSQTLLPVVARSRRAGTGMLMLCCCGVDVMMLGSCVAVWHYAQLLSSLSTADSGVGFSG